MLVKITSCRGNVHDAIYLDENQDFQFNNQTSEKKTPYTLTKGTAIIVDTEASNNRQLPIGGIYDCDGVFNNYYKTNPPVLTLTPFNIKFVG